MESLISLPVLALAVLVLGLLSLDVTIVQVRRRVQPVETYRAVPSATPGGCVSLVKPLLAPFLGGFIGAFTLSGALSQRLTLGVVAGLLASIVRRVLGFPRRGSQVTLRVSEQFVPKAEDSANPGPP